MADQQTGTRVDLHDVQGNIVKGYSRFGFPVARYVLYRVGTEHAGREFVRRLVRLITTAAPWTPGGAPGGTGKPDVTTNVAFTYEGLKKLAIPEASLHSFPEEFSMGMRARTTILGDTGPSAPEHWDPVWSAVDSSQVAHILVTINAANHEHLLPRYDQVTAELDAVRSTDPDGIVQLAGHRDGDGDTAPFQDGHALPDEAGDPTPTEHFGFVDGISDPYFADSGSDPTYVGGGGKRVRGTPADQQDGWAPLATGEFLLGHIDEGNEYPAAPIPTELARNGTYLVYRKLHQNVATFDRYIEDQAGLVGDPELVAAKMVGRWRNGAPLSTHPTADGADRLVEQLEQARAERASTDPSRRTEAAERYAELKQQLRSYDYTDDIDGARCPVGAHVRRANPRGSLEMGRRAFDRPGALVDRRRILRRGMPYGDSSDRTRDDGDHGIIFMALGASINRQFEFVQQQWMNYGNDFRLANERDPIVGSQPPSGGRMVVPADPGGTEPPVFLTDMPTFVETRGGDYFFVPSVSALHAIARGDLDPT